MSGCQRLVVVGGADMRREESIRKIFGGNFLYLDCGGDYMDLYM